MTIITPKTTNEAKVRITAALEDQTQEYCEYVMLQLKYEIELSKDESEIAWHKMLLEAATEVYPTLPSLYNVKAVIVHKTAMQVAELFIKACHSTSFRVSKLDYTNDSYHLSANQRVTTDRTISCSMLKVEFDSLGEAKLSTTFSSIPVNNDLVNLMVEAKQIVDKHNLTIAPHLASNE